MRIIFIFHMASVKGGASKSGLTLVKGLQKHGMEIVAVCPEEGTLSAALRKEDIKVEIFNYGWAYPNLQRSIKGILKYIPKLLINSYKNRKALKRMILFAEQFKPDIIHTNTGVADIGSKLARRLKLPHISHFREFGWKDCSAIMWHEQSLRSYPLQHGIAIGKDILKFHTHPGDDNILVYNGIVNQDDAKYCQDKDNYLLYVGALFKTKGIEDLLEAYSRITVDLRRKFPLKIAGSTDEGTYKQYLESLTAKLGIADEVEWLGERSDIKNLMCKAKALVVPSHDEAFGRIVVEGMINGCPVIGRNRAGIKEQFDNGLKYTSEEIGLRFESVEELSSIISKVLNSDTNYEKQLSAMTKRGQITVEYLYSVQHYVESVAEFYEKIINS